MAQPPSYVTLAQRKTHKETTVATHHKRLSSAQGRVDPGLKTVVADNLPKTDGAAPMEFPSQRADADYWLSGSVSPPSRSPSIQSAHDEPQPSRHYHHQDNVSEHFERLKTALLKLDAHKMLMLRSIWEYLISHKIEGGLPSLSIPKHNGNRPSRSWLVADRTVTSAPEVSSNSIQRPRFGSNIDPKANSKTQPPTINSRTIYRSLLTKSASLASMQGTTAKASPTHTPIPFPLGTLPSASFVLLKASLPSVLAEIFICTIRLEAALSRGRRQVINQLIRNKRLFKAFRGWKGYVKGKPNRNLQVCWNTVTHWQQFVRQRQEVRRIVRAFVIRFRNCVDSFNAVKIRYKRWLFTKWRAKAKSLRMAGMLLKFAKDHVGGPTSLLRLALQPTRAVTAVEAVLQSEAENKVQHLFSEHFSEVGSAGVEPSRPSLLGIAPREVLLRRAAQGSIPKTHLQYQHEEQAAALDRARNATAYKAIIQRIVFGHWRERLQRRRDVVDAAHLDRQRVLGTAFGLWRRQLEVILCRRDAQAIQQKRERDLVDASTPSYWVIQVADKSAATALTGIYADKAADVARSFSLCRYALHSWRKQYNTHLADKTFRNKLVYKALSRWYQKMQLVTTHRRVVRLLFGVWKDKLRLYRLRLLADDWRNSRLAKEALSRWHLAAIADRQYRSFTLKHKLREWAQKAQISQYQKVMRRTKALRHLQAWREYLYARRLQRQQVILANAISTRVVKVKVIRLWRQKLLGKQRDAIFAAITEDVRRRRVLTSALNRWVAKTHMIAASTAIITAQPLVLPPYGMNESREFM